MHNCLHPIIYPKLDELVLELFHPDSLLQDHSELLLRFHPCHPVQIQHPFRTKHRLPAMAKWGTIIRQPTAQLYFLDCAPAQCHNVPTLMRRAVHLVHRFSRPTGHQDARGLPHLRVLPASARMAQVLLRSHLFQKKEMEIMTCR